ncbi:hypothetical protein HMPREF2806_05860 [Corynebacterium sp. HMSC076G08]|uniref:hypothetical protein n=1 Tax=unclassified Corynebacterium TaxID=2624378 RepID=UPI0008A4ABC9|nr:MULTISPECIES: hypothetical protein [unclassified Corynebacterium]OFK68834.1 hypothetical protein HMPREF2806_05860 [Corynebacterium sp. HMSC076G08]OFN33645.1 hypothetical protein HMPREF2565_11960 [Corynebacterium sp. HMSC072A04]
MNTPNLMPARIIPPRSRLDELIDQAATTMQAYLAAGLTEDTALALTDITLDRFDQGAQP